MLFLVYQTLQCNQNSQKISYPYDTPTLFMCIHPVISLSCGSIFMATLIHCGLVPLLTHIACVVIYKEATPACLSHSIAT